jgi:F-type H+-transporting ATPase subunit a
VHDEYSFLFHPVNSLLAWLLGAPSEGWQWAMGVTGKEGIWLPDHVIMAMLVTLVVTVLAVIARRGMSLDKPGVLQQVFELVVSGLRGLTEDVIGHGQGARFVGFIAALTMFIFVSNAFGLIFFLQPPTSSTSTTAGLALTAFFFYHAVGIRASGWRYFKQFMGPVWWLFPLMIPLEIISHLARVLSLTLRLFGNISAEHTATGIFLVVLPFFVPAMMGLGVLGATIQTFIFIMLTTVYVSGAVAEEH